ncbi:MAG: hypothetical protein Kow0074_20570 [Candidatus Zixiibacteriota bacterium]
MTKPRYELKRIGLFSAIKTMFLLGGFGGFLLGMVQWAALWVMYGVIRNVPETAGLPQALELEMLLGAIGGAGGIFFPLSGGFVGSIVGVVGAFLLGGLYNTAARIWGGLEFEWDEVRTANVVTAPIPAPARAGEPTPLPGTAQAEERTPPEPPPDAGDRRDDDDDDGDPPRRPSSSMYE